MSKLLSTIAIAGLVLSLVACSGTSGGDAKTAGAACTATKSGAATDKVTVSGKIGTAPTVKIATPLTSTTTERSVAITGKGAIARDGNSATIDYSVYNATTGKQLDVTKYSTGSAAPVTLSKTKLLPGLYKAVLCSTVGSRIVAVIPPVDAFGSTGSTSLGIAATDSIVFVIDVVSVTTVLPKADGVPQAPETGLPTVTLAKEGTPTVTIPKADPPTTLTIAVLKKGTGKTVTDGATVTVHYLGVLWATGKTFDSSWSRGTPASFSTKGVVPGFGTALVGQTVGSQVLAIIPPDQGYGAKGSTDGSISGTDTMVFVIDILATN
ncbi:MAG: FKBP-type peptidyl-prolyl cis-trans isomerase [Lacisediminihabitans sp.]